MNKADWDSLGENEKNGVVAEAVMRWTLEEVSDPSGAINYGGSFCNWVAEDGRGMYEQYEFYPTYDRDDCDLVLDEIEKRGLIVECANELDDEVDTNFIVDEWQELMAAAWKFLRADPDTICYCAVRAIENENT